MKINPIHERHYDSTYYDSTLIPKPDIVYMTTGIEDTLEILQEQQVPGGSTPSQYALPDGARELQDLIEYRNMDFALGNIMKACYRIGHCSHADKLRDLNKIKWFVERAIAAEEKKRRTSK